MKIKRIVVIAILAILIIFQFLAHKDNVSSYESVSKFEQAVNLPNDVSAIFKESCYDCHSNHTNYPWYASVGVVNYMLNHHIEEGKEHLNFSDWEKYPERRQLHKLAEIYEEVEEGEMPLKSYRITHGDLTETQRNTILTWSKQFEEEEHDHDH